MNKDKKMSNDENLFDFHGIGQAIRKGRKKQGMTREQLAEKIGMSFRNMAEIENCGQHPRFQNFYELVTMFNISVDEYFYPASKPAASTMRRRVDSLLDGLSDRELAIIEATIQGIGISREMGEETE